jgi:two-component system nitrate/nitrite response regulator NarL
LREVLVSSRERISVLIADGDNMGCQLMAGALRRCRNYFDVVAVASNSPDAISKLEAYEPQVAVVSPDLQDGPQTGFKVLQELRRSHPGTAGVMLLHSLERAPVIDAFRYGARGVISRDDSFKELSKCIRYVHLGRIWATNEDLEIILEALSQIQPIQINKADGTALLTPREKDAVRLVVEGMKNREIAESLHVTEHTVSNYLYRIFDKLGVSSRVELILYVTSHRQIE